jgi:hypothetical protein
MQQVDDEFILNAVHRAWEIGRQGTSRIVALLQHDDGGQDATEPIFVLAPDTRMSASDDTP